MSAALDLTQDLLGELLNEETFFPQELRTLKETGLPPAFIEGLTLKFLSALGSAAGRVLADRVALPFGLMEELFRSLRQRQLVTPAAAAEMGDYVYQLTESGRERGRAAMAQCGYLGPAPVPIEDYLTSVEAQSIRGEVIRKDKLRKAFAGLSVPPELFDALGPAVNSGSGMFLYGAPGNGKTSFARRITRCFGNAIWIPHAFTDDGQIIKLYDAACHEQPEQRTESSLLKKTTHDRRWLRISRPTVVVGGELTLDNLELRHDPRQNVCEAPVQLKSNCGCLLIDDFGRQRCSPQDLLNRWIVPLESRIDFLTLPTGKKFQVPFEQLIIFSTNLEPHHLADDAFLRRIPYKIEITDPTEPEFYAIFERSARDLGFPYNPSAVRDLIETVYKSGNRPMRRCQPRDLLSQLKNYCQFNGLPREMRSEYFLRAASTYFTVVKGG